MQFITSVVALCSILHQVVDASTGFTIPKELVSLNPSFLSNFGGNHSIDLPSDRAGLPLALRQSTCPSGYGECTNRDSCCPIGGQCCDLGGCCNAGELCCEHSCIPSGTNCCDDGGYCYPGNQCYHNPRGGRDICCTNPQCTAQVGSDGRATTATLSYTYAWTWTFWTYYYYETFYRSSYSYYTTTLYITATNSAQAYLQASTSQAALFSSYSAKIEPQLKPSTTPIAATQTEAPPPETDTPSINSNESSDDGPSIVGHPPPNSSPALTSAPNQPSNQATTVVQTVFEGQSSASGAATHPPAAAGLANSMYSVNVVGWIGVVLGVSTGFLTFIL